MLGTLQIYAITFHARGRCRKSTRKLHWLGPGQTAALPIQRGQFLILLANAIYSLILTLRMKSRFIPRHLLFVVPFLMVSPVSRAFPADPFFFLSNFKFLKAGQLRNDCPDALLPEGRAVPCGDECGIPEGSRRLIELLAAKREKLSRAGFIALLKDLEQKGTLETSVEGVVDFVIRGMQRAGLEVPSKPSAQVAQELTHLMRAELRSEEWITQQKADALLRAKLRSFDVRAGLGSLKFWNFLKEHAGANQTIFNSMELLPGNSQSMKARLGVIANAKYSLDIFSWGWVDDSSGEEIATALIRKKQETPSIRIRVLVDGIVAKQEKYNDTVKILARNGIEVLPTRVSNEPFQGMHQKGILRDAWSKDLAVTPELILGGRNPGDDYLLDEGWSDFDIKISGSAIRDAAIRFQELWNRSALASDPPYGLMLEPLPRRSYTFGGISMGLLNHSPDRPGEDPILLTTLAILRAAEKQVWISNAYFLPSPILLNAIAEAIGRGVVVRILTNSPISIDERALAIPMLESAKQLKALGAKVYLKQGKTLHEKVLLADSKIGMVGSYNYHPRSQWYEREWAMVFSDATLTKFPAVPKFQKELDSRFEAAIPLDSYLESQPPPDEASSAQESFFMKIYELFRRQF